MNDLETARQKAATTYNAAADFFDHPANSFWARYGRRTIEKLALKSGERVLDVCCGSGASAIPAAEMVVLTQLSGILFVISGRTYTKASTPGTASRKSKTCARCLPPAGFDGLEIVAENGSQPVNSPSDWWAMIMGSGYRGTVEQLTPEAREQVRQQNGDFIQRTGIRSVECNVVYATAIKPSA